MERRSFVKQAAALGLAGLAQAQSRERLKAGLIGCGGRGTEAVVDMLTGSDQVELVAMADIFEDKLERSLTQLRNRKFLSLRGGDAASLARRVRVEPDRHFVGFQSFEKLLASNVDIVMLCTPPGYRPMHFEAAVNAGKHVFAEKPIATDPVGVRRFMAAVGKATEKKLTVVGGAQRHAQREYTETVAKIRNGAIGDLVAAFAWYLSGPVFHVKARDSKWGDMEWQHRNWYSFLWLCGDQIVEQHYHNIDFMNWVFGTHPAKVVASGGTSWRTRDELNGNIFDHMSSDFVYPNGVHLTSHCRQYPQGVYRNVSDLLVGTKGKSTGMDLGAKGIHPQVQEHINLIRSIRGEGPYLNEGMRVAEATMTCIMGRESAYSGQEITWDQIMASKQDLMPKAFDYKLQMTPPELPVPGKYKFV